MRCCGADGSIHASVGGDVEELLLRQRDADRGTGAHAEHVGSTMDDGGRGVPWWGAALRSGWRYPRQRWGWVAVRLRRRNTNEVRCLYAGHLGSTGLATDAAGRVHLRRLFRPYGEPRWQDGTLPTDFGFAGQRHDGSTGLVFMHARYYDARLGRFVSVDTVVPDPSVPQDFNRYAYTRNSPVNLTDPGGEIAPIVAIPLIVGGVALLVDWGVQVYQNVCTRNMSFWDAVYYRNLDWNKMATVGVTAAGTTVMVLGGTQMVLVGGSLMLWQIGIWAQSPTAMQWGNTMNAWAAQYSAWLWSSQTILDRLQRAATQADRTVPGRGAVVGTRRHTVFQGVVDSWDDPHLGTEVSYYGGELAPHRGYPGSVRLDVVEYSAGGEIVAIYDYKTGNAVLTPGRIAQIRAQLPSYAQNVPIIIIRGR